MSDVPDSSTARRILSPMEKIEVLLHEYDTLRDEAVENISRQQAFLTAWLTLLVAFFALASQLVDSPLVAFAPALVLALLSLEAGRQYSLVIKSVYIQALEKQINDLAGEQLLMWEQAGSDMYLLALKLRRPSGGKSVLNTNLLVTAVYPIVVAALFSAGLFLGSTYLYGILASPLNIVIVIAYVCLHFLTLAFILFSRLVQERKVFAVYKERVLMLRETTRS